MGILDEMLEAIKAEVEKEAFRAKYVISEKDFTRNRKQVLKPVKKGL